MRQWLTGWTVRTDDTRKVSPAAAANPVDVLRRRRLSGANYYEWRLAMCHNDEPASPEHH